METTSSWRHARSDLLKKLDAAIAAANGVEIVDDSMMREYTSVRGELSESAKSAQKLEEAKRKVAVASVSKAFTAWAGGQTLKGQNWRDSTRNGAGAMTKLHEQLVYWKRIYPDVDPTSDTGVALAKSLAILVKERNESIPLLFKDCKVVLVSQRADVLKDKMKRAEGKKNAAKIIKNSVKLSRGSPGVPPRPPTAPSSSGSSLGALSSFATQVDDMVKSAFGVAPGDISWDAGETFFKEVLGSAISSIKEEIAALAPGVGLGVASATLVSNAVKLVMHGIAADEMLDLTRKLELGDSQAALKRVRDWQLRDIALRTSKVARASVNVGVQSAAIASCGVGIPAQLALGLANSILALGEVIADLGMQYKESRALTKYLNERDSSHPLDQNIFAAAPLAAAYYLLNTPISHVALQLVVIGAPAWQEDVGHLQKSGVLKTVVEESARLIAASRYRIERNDGGQYRDRVGKTLAVKASELVGKTPLRGTRVMDSAASDSSRTLLRSTAVRGL